MQTVEQRTHRCTHPPDNHQDLDYVGRQKPPTAAHEQPVRPPRFPRVHLIHVLLRREQGRENHPPRPAPAVQLRRLQRVVELHLLRKHVAPY